MCRKINKCTKEQRRSLNVERLIKYIGLTRIYYFVCRKNLIGHCEEMICLLVETWSLQSNESWKFFFMIESNFWKMEYHKIFDFWKKKHCHVKLPFLPLPGILRLCPPRASGTSPSRWETSDAFLWHSPTGTKINKLNIKWTFCIGESEFSTVTCSFSISFCLALLWDWAWMRFLPFCLTSLQTDCWQLERPREFISLLRTPMLSFMMNSGSRRIWFSKS